MRSLCLGLILMGLGPLSCKTLRPQTAELSSLAIDCQQPISLQAYLQPETSCAADGVFSAEEARKRALPPWIPCNDVEWIDDTQDLFGPGAGNDPETLALSTYQRIFRDWLGQADRFSATMAPKVFQNLDQPLTFNANNPILDSAMARTLKDMIQSAQHNIMMDIFLLGGSWGAEILHDLAAAADRGVEVVLIHDNVSKFSVANEMDPLWHAAQQFSLQHPRFVALDANIRTPNRVSSLPLGLDKITAVLGGLLDLSVSPEGKSDHSKVLIVDALHPRTLDDYSHIRPRALVMSRNLVDSAASFYHDEGVVFRGPAAVVTLLHYQSDLFWAWDQAKKARKLNAADESLLQSVHDRMETLRTKPVRIKGQGWVSVQPTQVSANDEVRNLDASIIPRIMTARESVDLYGRIAYNWPLALALKDALDRGVKVRIILDQQTTMGALGNAVLPYMMAALFHDAGKTISEGDLPVRWFLPFRPGKAFGSKDRTDLAQEIHAKTIIIDNRLALFGSANMDALSWAGGFREYSVWVDDPALAAESARLFDRLWNHSYLTVSHKVWLGDEAPAPEVQQYFAERQSAAGCDPKAELCRPETILQGGKPFPEKGPQRELIKSVLAADAERIRLLTPSRIQLNNGACRKF